MSEIMILTKNKYKFSNNL